MKKQQGGFGILGLIIVLLIIGAIGAITWFVWTARSTANTKSTPTSPNAIVAKFTYTDEGFQPSSISMKKGESFRVLNKSKEPIPVDLYEPLSSNTSTNGATMDTVIPGANQVFLLNETGTWKVKNHNKPEHTASVVVHD